MPLIATFDNNKNNNKITEYKKEVVPKWYPGRTQVLPKWYPIFSQVEPKLYPGGTQVVPRCIPDICHFFYTGKIFGE